MREDQIKQREDDVALLSWAAGVSTPCKTGKDIVGEYIDCAALRGDTSCQSCGVVQP